LRRFLRRPHPTKPRFASHQRGLFWPICHLGRVPRTALGQDRMRQSRATWANLRSIFFCWVFIQH
jgi:hypothetical protein